MPAVARSSPDSSLEVLDAAGTNVTQRGPGLGRPRYSAHTSLGQRYSAHTSLGRLGPGLGRRSTIPSYRYTPGGFSAYTSGSNWYTQKGSLMLAHLQVA